MELRQLKYFTTVARTLNFSEAAKQLYITQGTLSQQIKQLEDELGVLLFKRTSRKVSITEEGMELLPLVEKIVEDASRCKNIIRDMKHKLTGSLNIGVTWTFKTLVTDAVKNFMRVHPGVTLNIRCGTAQMLHEQLLNKKMDLIVAFRPMEDYPNEVAEELVSSHLSMIMSADNPMAGKKSINVDELEGKKLILPNGGIQGQKGFVSMENVDISKLDIRAEVNDVDMALDLIQGTNMMAVMSAYEVHGRPGLVTVPLTGIQKKMPGCVFTLRDIYQKKSVKVFIEFLRDCAVIENACRSAAGDD